jgi:Phage integrase family
MPVHNWPIQRVGGQLLRSPTKTESSGASLPLPDLCLAAFKLRRQQQDDDRHKAGDAWIDTGLIFTTRHGIPIEPRNFNRSFDRLIAQADVPKITVHGTRKMCGSLLATLDVHQRVAMQILRHSKIAITMVIYTEVASAATRDALKKLASGSAPEPARCCTLLLHQDQKGRFRDRNQPCDLRSPLTESNRRPSPYHGDALPTELRGPGQTLALPDRLGIRARGIPPAPHHRASRAYTRSTHPAPSRPTPQSQPGLPTTQPPTRTLQDRRPDLRQPINHLKVPALLQCIAPHIVPRRHRPLRVGKAHRHRHPLIRRPMHQPQRSPRRHQPHRLRRRIPRGKLTRPPPGPPSPRQPHVSHLVLARPI